MAQALRSMLAITVTICCASQRAKASLYVELVGNRFGQFNWQRSQACLSSTQSTIPFTVVSPASFLKPQQGQQQGQRIAFSLLLASISYLFKRTIQGGWIEGCPVPVILVLPHFPCSAIVLINQEINAERH